MFERISQVWAGRFRKQVIIFCSLLFCGFFQRFCSICSLKNELSSIRVSDLFALVEDFTQLSEVLFA